MYTQDQTQKAAQALLKHLEQNKKESNNLLGEDADGVYLNISTKKYLTDRKQLKPKRVLLPNPINNKETSVCLFTKDPQRSYKDALQGDDSVVNGLVDRVIGVSKLKGKFKPYQARRSLLSGHELFLAQDSVVTTLPKLLGKVFFDGPVGRVPLSVKLTNKDNEIDEEIAKKEIEKCLNSTAFILSPGSMASIKIGTTDHDAAQLAENVDAVVKYFTENVQNWDMIRSMYIKAQESQSLPIFMAESVKNADAKEEKEEADAKSEKRKREANELTDFEQQLTEHFDADELESFTNKKIKS